MSRGFTPSAVTSSRSCSTVGGVLKMSMLRKAAFFCFRKSTDFRQVDQVGFWKTTISLAPISPS